MSLKITINNNKEPLNCLKYLQDEIAKYSTPKKPQRPHNRIVSLRVEKTNQSREYPHNFSKTNSLHHKTHSLMAGAQDLELKIKKLEDSIEKTKRNSKISTRTQSSKNFPEDSIEVSCSSEDSLSILREQVDLAKNLGDLPEKKLSAVLGNFPETLSDTRMSFSSQTPEKRVTHHKSITEFAFLNAIPIIHLT